MVVLMMLWEPEWIEERFACIMTCQNPECGQAVAVVGSAEHVEDHDWESQTMHWSRMLLPQSVIPAPPIFPLPDECPVSVASELKRAFRLFWVDPGSCANRLRVAAEALLTHQKIPRTALTKKGRREPLSLHARIERFKAKDAESADYMLAIKWLGNAGSHHALDDVSDSDLLAGFEFLEHVIERLFVQREKRLKSIAREIRKRKGKAIRRKSDFW